jgi:chemotaxis protein CheY-P-specific phosphatase CheC
VSVDAVNAVQIALPEIASLERVSKADVYVGVYFTLHGEHLGSSLVLLSRADACKLVDVASRKPVGSTTVLDDYAQSAIREIANIMAGAFFAAVRRIVPVLLLHSVPRLVIDQWQQLIAALVPHLARDGESPSLIECELVVETMSARCFLLIVVGKWE